MRWSLLPLLAGLASCATVNRALDEQAIADRAAIALKAVHRRRAPPLPFASAAELEARTAVQRLPTVDVLPVGARTLGRDDVIEEQWAFHSRVRLRHPESNLARLYVYRKGALGERPIQLWVPGLYVSDTALALLRRFFTDAIDRGVDVVFYVPPYHLERTPGGFESGDAVLATDLPDHLGVIAQGVADLRDVTALLRRTGAPVGVFAGSMGASLALQVARFDGDFAFFTAMIPLVSWTALLFDRPEFRPVLARLERQGHGLAALRRLYGELNPATWRPAAASRVSVLAARFDQVTPAAPREAWQAAWGVHRVTEFDRGHATILLTAQVYEEAGRRLEEDLANLQATAARFESAR